MCNSDIMCGQLHCSPTGDVSASFASSLFYDRSMLYVTDTTSTRHDCDSVIIDVGMQQQDPGLAPTGAKCGDGMVLVALHFTAVTGTARRVQIKSQVPESIVARV